MSVSRDYLWIGHNVAKSAKIRGGGGGELVSTAARDSCWLNRDYEVTILAMETCQTWETTTRTGIRSFRGVYELSCRAFDQFRRLSRP